jgi:hypothetical protein
VRRVPLVGAAAALAVAASIGGSAADSQGELRITARPGLFPGFDAGVTDYVSRCGQSHPLTLSVQAPE